MSRILSAMLLLVLLTGCIPLQPQKQSDSEACDPSLASCSVQDDRDLSLYVEPVPVDRDTLHARVAELKRWLAWQRQVVLGETDQPFEALDKLIEAAPQSQINAQLSPRERLRSVQLLAQAGESNEALQLAEELFQLDPNDIETLTLYSALLTESGQIDRSLQLLDQALATHPDSPELYNNQAANYAARGDLGRAIELLQTAFSTHPSFAQIQFNLKQLYQATARRALAPLETFDAPSLNPIQLHYNPDVEIQESAEALIPTAHSD